MDFAQVLKIAGLEPRHITNDGKVYRCKTATHPNKQNGAYSFSGDWGWFQDWATMSEAQIWFSDKPMTEARKREIETQRAEQRRADAMARIGSIKAMRTYFSGLNPLWGGHAYLDSKGLTMLGCAGLRVDGDVLVVPMYNAAGDLMSLQKIKPCGEKRYQFNCPTKALRLVLARDKSVITLFCEGFATGLTLFEAMPNASVVVCFDAGNLVNVARDFKARGLTAVVADNDHETEARVGLNNGILKATQAAEILRCGMVYPTGIDGSDYNDLMVSFDKREAAFAKIKGDIMRGVKMVA